MMMRFVPLFSRTMAGLLLSSCITLSAFAAGIPDLPQEFRVKQPGLKVTVLEFSAPWCSSCRKLKPYVKVLKKETGDKMHLVDLNVEDPGTQKYIDKYGLATIPAYILYNAQGKPLQKVEREITPEELRSLVMDAIKKSK